MIPGVNRETLQVEVKESLVIDSALIVDEAVPIQRKLLDILHRAGFAASRVQMTADAESAMELFVREHPGVVFAEFVGDDPEEGLAMVLEMLKLDPQARVVLVTAEPRDSAVVRRAVRMGAFAVVEKPVRHETIRALLTDINNEAGGIERFR